MSGAQRFLSNKSWVCSTWANREVPQMQKLLDCGPWAVLEHTCNPDITINN